MGEPENFEAPPPGEVTVSHKNLLQQFTQRASIQLPVYKTTCEAQNPPSFISQVCVNGMRFSSSCCANKKMAEQEVAKIALVNMVSKAKEEGISFVHEGIVSRLLCKAIMNEYANKTNVEKPTYNTVKPEGLQVFVSSLTLNGVTFTGDAATNKKDAENFAARSAIVSILGSESETTMSEIVRSKFRLVDAMKSRKDSSEVSDVSVPIEVNQGEDPPPLNNKRKADEVDDSIPLHELKMPRLEPLAETSRKKKNRKKKTKAEKKALVDAPPLPSVVMPLVEAPSLVVTQCVDPLEAVLTFESQNVGSIAFSLGSTASDMSSSSMT